MKLFLYILFGLFTALSNCNAQNNDEKAKENREKKVLIVYLSRTNNTKAIAEIIHTKTAGDLIALELQQPYPEDYRKTVEQVSEENRIGFLPPLKTKIDNIKQYDIVFVGFPTWGMRLPPPVKSFLSEYNFSGQTIVPFNTHAGYGAGSGFDDVKELTPNSAVLEGFSIKGGIERDDILFVMEGEKAVAAEKQIVNWLHKIGIK